MTPEQQMLAQWRELSSEQQQKVIEWATYLATSTQPRSNSGQPVSALQAAGDLVGCFEGPEDLSTNPDYLQGLGQR